MTTADRPFSSLPLFHSAGQQLAVMSTLTVGTDIALARWFSASEFWDQIRRHDATRFFYIGTMLQVLLNREPAPDDGDHPAAFGMGAAAPVELVPDFERRFDVELLDSYGLTETGTLATFTEPGDANGTRDGAAGRPVDHIDLRIADDRDRPVETGTVGEILLRPRRPNTTMLGYLGEAEQTVETWQNLWLHTGDMGYVDEAGRLYFVDRKAYTIRHRGENVSARQVEKTLMTHPAVEEVAVVGVPGELGDEDVKAVVKARDPVEPAALIDHCEGDLAGFKIPRYVEFTESFPKTETERIEKYKLKSEGVGDAWDRQAAEGE
jgi:acyl-CoA synthetase (AMP-forming)/AMP-acid ligase II